MHRIEARPFGPRKIAFKIGILRCMVLRKLIVGIKRKMILIPRALSSITLQLTEKTRIAMIRIQIESIPLARRAAVFANQLQSPLVVRQNRARTEIVNPRPLVAPIAVAG